MVKPSYLQAIIPWAWPKIFFQFPDDLIVDPRNFEWIREANCPVVSICICVCVCVFNVF